MALCSHWWYRPFRCFFSFLLPFMTTGYLCSYRTTEVISHYAIWRMRNYERIACNLFIHWDSPVIKSTAAYFSGKPFFFFFSFLFLQGVSGRWECTSRQCQRQRQKKAGLGSLCADGRRWRGSSLQPGVQGLAGRTWALCHRALGVQAPGPPVHSSVPALILPVLFIVSLCAAPPARGTAAHCLCSSQARTSSAVPCHQRFSLSRSPGKYYTSSGFVLLPTNGSRAACHAARFCPTKIRYWGRLAHGTWWLLRFSSDGSLLGNSSGMARLQSDVPGAVSRLGP